MSQPISDIVQDVADVYRRDINFIIENLERGDETGYWARSLVRTTVSLIEAELYEMKLDILETMDLKQLDDDLTKQALLGRRPDITDTGELRERENLIPLKNDLKFVLKKKCKIESLEMANDFNSSGWQSVLATIDIRNRLTHPKELEEQTVSDDEVEIAVSAFEWFYQKYSGFIEQKNTRIEALSKDIEERFRNE